MPEISAHPSREQLSAYNLGQLPPDEAVAIESHISACEPCCDTIIRLSSDDTFVGLLKKARHLPNDPTVDRGTETDPSSCQDVPAQLAEHPRYAVLRLIGKGGMGDVYKARHRKMERTVALKVINRGLVRKAEAIDRFHREVKAAAQLSHPNIVTAYDADQAGDFHFMVMEYIDGVDLSRTVKDRDALQVAEACDYIRQAAVGLQHAHQRGMVHRDIKPHNLMVTKDGTIKILDFGLASLAPEAVLDPDSVEARSELTAAGAVMGTPDFISPEQATDARQADIRSDIYSLGATLYFLLTGRPPFAEGSVMHKVKSHTHDEPEPLESLRNDVPTELSAIVSRMMAKNPDERYQTPAEVAEALKSFCRSAKLRQDVEPQAPAKRHRWKTAYLPRTAVAALFIVALFAGLIYYIQTNHGTIRVEVTDPSLQLSIKDHTITMKDGNKALIIRPGEQSLIVRKDDADFEFETDRFQIRRGDQIAFRVELVRGEIVVRKDGDTFDIERLDANTPPMGEAKVDSRPKATGEQSVVQHGQGVTSDAPAISKEPAEAAPISDGAAEADALSTSPNRKSFIKQKTTAFLIEATKSGDLASVEAALEAGVDPNGPANQLTALHWAVARRISDGQTIEPSAEIAQRLIEAGANVNAADYLGQTPLEWAASHASPEIVTMLLDAGANVNAESRYGTVLQATRNVEVAKVLIEAGANVNDRTATTSLAKAAQFNDVHLIRLLIEKGAPVNDPNNPPIHWVGKSEAVKALLEAGADVNLRNPKGETVLHLPFPYFGPDEEAVTLLIDEGADVNAKSKSGSTPLHAAIQQQKPAIATLFIAAGAEVDAKDKQGNTPLSIAYGNLSWARGNASVDSTPYEASIKLLVDAGAKDDGRTKLQQAVAIGDLEQVRKLIADAVDVNATGPQGTTAMHIASENGHAEILAALIEAGAKVDVLDAQRMRPLHLAANAEIARLLIANGANVNLGLPSPLYMATMKGKADVVRELLRNDANATDGDCATMLNWATFAGQLEVVHVLFQSRDPKALLAVQSTYSPLHVAASGSFGDMGSPASAQQRLEIAKLLVEQGADVNASWGKNINRRSGAAFMIDTRPLMFASDKGEVEMVKFLLEKGGDATASNASGQTALHFAAQNGHRPVVELLLKAEVNVNALTREAKTPLDLAQDAAVKVLLIQAGGKSSNDVLKDSPAN